MSGALGATAAAQDLIINQFSTFSLEIVWTDANGDPITLVDASAIMQFRTSTAASNILFQASTANTMITFGTTQGSILIKIPASVTGSFVFTNAVYDLLVQLPQGDCRRLLTGNISVLAGVSVLIVPAVPS
jgi:hypothetical protein